MFDWYLMYVIHRIALVQSSWYAQNTFIWKVQNAPQRPELELSILSVLRPCRLHLGASGCYGPYYHPISLQKACPQSGTETEPAIDPGILLQQTPDAVRLEYVHLDSIHSQVMMIDLRV